MKRGDVVLAVASGDYGKPRPALVVQSDYFNPTHASLTVCPITSELIDARLFRLPVEPGPTNGLRKRSQIMVDKIQSLRRARVRSVVGRLTAKQLGEVDGALRLWLGLQP